MSRQYYEIDWDKIKTIEELKLILSLVDIKISKESFEKIKHFMVEENNGS